jgi:iron complex outermembrane receptor protein
VFGNKDFESEDLIAYELGYRAQPSNWFAVDVATFYNTYKHLRSLESTAPNLIIDNKLHGDTYGAEVGATLKAADRWKFRTAYTYLQVHLHPDSDSTDTMTARSEGNDPHDQLYVQSSMDLPYHLDLDCMVRYVSELRSQGVPAYVAADVRLAWRPNDRMEFAIVGQNLFDNRHPEFGAGANQHEIERGVYAMFTLRW